MLNIFLKDQALGREKNKASIKYIIYENNLMAKRTTIMIEDSLDKKVRRYQAKRLQKENAMFSYSKAINEILRRSI